MAKELNVRGRRLDLSEGRLVYVGKSEERPGFVFVGFRNSAGEDTKLILSDEAAEALKNMLTSASYGYVCGDFPHKAVWAVCKPNPEDFFEDRPT